MKGIVEKIKRIGPAFILAAVVLGPGSITLSTLAGSQYGYSLLWVVPLSTLLMITYTLLAARITLVTGYTILENVRRRFGKMVSVVAGVMGFLSILAFQAGNSAAVGFSGEAFWGIDTRVWAIIALGLASGFILTRGLYGKLEVLVKLFVAVMIVAFFGSLILVGVSGGEFLSGLIPRFPDSGSVFLSLGMIATTFSVAAAVYQSYLMREKGWGVEELSVEGVDTVTGILILGIISGVILMTSAGVLYSHGIEVQSAQQMALQLEPVAGPLAFFLFMTGFFFASFSSLVINPLVGATLLVDAVSEYRGLETRNLKFTALGVLAFGTGVVCIFSGSPIELLRMAQAAAVIAFPVLGLLVWMLARDRGVMGEYAIPPIIDILTGAGYVIVLAIAINTLRQIVT